MLTDYISSSMSIASGFAAGAGGSAVWLPPSGPVLAATKPIGAWA